jgi:hypothetical protein
LLALALAGCSGREAGIYDLPVETVFERLKAGDMNDFRRARQCGLLIHFSTEGMRNEEVRWVVRSSGAEVASFAARLTPLDGGRTKVTIDVPKASDGGEIYDGTKTYPRPALHQPLRPAIAELIDARLEQRPFDVWRIPEAVRVTDDICSIQRAGLEAGSARFRHDGNDNVGRGRPRHDTGTSVAPGAPMLAPKPSR